MKFFEIANSDRMDVCKVYFECNNLNGIKQSLFLYMKEILKMLYDPDYRMSKAVINSHISKNSLDFSQVVKLFTANRDFIINTAVDAYIEVGAKGDVQNAR